jgi:hypothetical protein
MPDFLARTPVVKSESYRTVRVTLGFNVSASFRSPMLLPFNSLLYRLERLPNEA